MGTNYYWTEDPCQSPCKHCDGGERLHIGKSSWGWCFSLHVIPYDGINSLNDWKAKFAVPGSRITNEYGEVLSAEEMVRTITERHSHKDEDVKPYGYSSWEQFHRDNGSRPGPNGCLRHKVDGVHCVGNGEGTWDYITGEFS